tara:strand:- start:3024 stop:3746 length:723 start_codon:yes stop_codon:yes gene_type:complete
MRILLILFFLLQASYLKANEINYLLDIPNLEIYKLNNTNGIKYLNAKKNFIIGINNNISCNKATKENLNKKFPIIKQNLEIYDSDFLKKINLRFIVLCEGLYISEINTAGIPNHAKRTLILDLNFNEIYFERVMHHEIFHLIQNSFKEIFNESIWSKFNDDKFKYAECSTCSDRLGLDLYNKTNGFLTEYSKSIASEDMAEVYSFLITDKMNIKTKSKKDSILLNKIKFIESGINQINNF